ncbi:1-acylglycerol-3-phosphate O-acyltransferase ABHD5-like, partial [Branchiostoma lanceolatum]|uniref:1-acylglycerol-3-phosphate O-acyltransferase ABHD5-like n=1 Tax=Branchiostoma lanceolatum TaxID=7740 RepID=UPI003451AE31
VLFYFRSWLWSWLRWCPTSLQHLAAAESRVLKYVKSTLERLYVPISNGRRIWTLKVRSKKPDTLPIVIIHGFGGAAAHFFLNFDALAEDRAVYAFDILGFGRSSRCEFSTNADVAEKEFVESIEEWRKGVGLERFILMGTSFGGFLATSYAIKHPERVKHLILAEPWGFPERTEQAAETLRGRLCKKSLFIYVGPQLLRWTFPDLRTCYADAFPDNTVTDFVYHCAAQPPSAETAFMTLRSSGWELAKNPMLPRLTRLHPDVPITFIYGADSWVDSRTGELAATLRKDSYVNIINIQNAGHKMYAEQHGEFNRQLVRVCEHADRAQ